jgi:hypothetical protein
LGSGGIGAQVGGTLIQVRRVFDLFWSPKCRIFGKKHVVLGQNTICFRIFAPDTTA